MKLAKLAAKEDDVFATLPNTGTNRCLKGKAIREPENIKLEKIQS